MTEQDIALLKTLAPFTVDENEIKDRWDCFVLTAKDVFIHGYQKQIGSEGNDDYTKRVLDITAKLLNDAAGIPAQ
jgi:hypothetical protein